MGGEGSVTFSEESISDKTDLNDLTSSVPFLLKVLSFVVFTTSSSI